MSFLKYSIDCGAENVDSGVFLVLRYFQSDKFLEKVKSAYGFNHTYKSPPEVAEDIKNYSNTIKIKSYTSRWPWSRAIAYTQNGVIYFNTRKSMDAYKRANTIVHETMHIMGYSHDGNTPSKYNDLTVPYYVGDMFEEFLCQELNRN